MKPVANPSASAEFLQWWRRDGPWLLTRITPDRKGFQSRSFSGRSLSDLRRWLDESVNTHNIYFHVNPTIRDDMQKKAEREDIAELAWLHVDIDPRAGEHIDAERTRALEMLTTRLPAGVPPPSAVVFSGGGYQGFWRLSDPMPIGGQVEAYEQAKRYNIALELAFGADNCHNVDRIMRLPGTINWPDAKKLKKGRVPTLAEVVELHDDRVYSLRQFTPAPQVQLQTPLGFSGATASGSAIKVETSGNLPRVADLDELNQWGVPDRVKVIAVQGHDPENPKQGDNSRSMWVFDFCCNMHRAGVPDEIVLSILLDPDYEISASILEKGANAERYAIRQLERAKEHAVDPMLREFNERFAVIGNLGGKCRIIEEVEDRVLNRSRLTRQSFEDFRNRHSNRYVEVPGADGKPMKIPAGKWWLANPHRRQYEQLIFDPVSTPPGAYNLWRGFGVTPRPGDAHEVFLKHTREVICNGNEEHYQYLIRWLAKAVQQPDQPGEVAIVLRGGMGIGKGAWNQWVARLWGRHALQVSNPGHLVGNFNHHLRDCIHLFADEAFYAGDKKHENVLRTLITERVVMIEAKGVDAEQQPNYLHIVMASNHHWVVPTGADERRFLVLDVSDTRKQQHGYFNEFLAPLRQGEGAENLLHFLMNLDITDFNVRQVPKTKALEDQKIYSMSPEDAWWVQKLEEGALLKEHSSWELEISSQELQQDYVNAMRDAGVTRRASPTSLGRFLQKVCPEGLPSSFQKMAKVEVIDKSGYAVKVTRRVRFYRFPPLAVCREIFEKRFGFAGQWLESPLPLGSESSEDELPPPY